MCLIGCLFWPKFYSESKNRYNKIRFWLKIETKPKYWSKYKIKEKKCWEMLFRPIFLLRICLLSRLSPKMGNNSENWHWEQNLTVKLHFDWKYVRNSRTMAGPKMDKKFILTKNEQQFQKWTPSSKRSPKMNTIFFLTKNLNLDSKLKKNINFENAKNCLRNTL